MDSGTKHIRGGIKNSMKGLEDKAEKKLSENRAQYKTIKCRKTGIFQTEKVGIRIASDLNVH